MADPAPLEAIGSPLAPPPPLGLVGEVAVEEEEEDEDVALAVGEVCPSSSAPASLQEKEKK